MRRLHGRLVALLLAGTVLATGACTSAATRDAGREGTGSPPSSDAATPSVAGVTPPPSEPEPGTTAAAEAAPQRSDLDVGAPEDWEVWQVQRLVFAVPPGMEPSTELMIPSSAATFVPSPDEQGDTLAALAVFVETGAVGPLDLRTELIRDIRNDQTGTEPLQETAVDVPGSVGAAALVYRYDETAGTSGRVLDSLQVDVTVQVPDPGPQLGVFLSGASSYLTREDLDTFVQSLRVVDADPAAGTAG